jgi:hypothetical protein
VLSKLFRKESLGTNLLISFLIRYPQFSTLRFSPETNKLSFTVLLKESVPLERQKEFAEKAEAHFAAAKLVDPAFASMGSIHQSQVEGITMIVYEQDVNILTIAEVRLFVSLVSDAYHGLVDLEGDSLQEEELDRQEAIIESILGQREHLREERLIVAYRDGGRVFVYNK